jgi:chemotaxis protein MotA
MSPIIGLSGIGFALWFMFNYPTEGFSGYWDVPSAVLLGLCPPSVMMLSHTFSDLLTGFKTLIKSAFTSQRQAEVSVINALTQASALVRSEGIGALVKIRNHVRYDLLREGISLIVNDFSEEEIRHNIEAKISAKQAKMGLAGNLFENMAKVSPGCGMLGTVLGLIAMMATLNDPSKIGAGMALAMITTLYGLILGTFIYAPCAEKINLETERALEIDMLVLEGVLSLKGKKSSVHLNAIMKTYSSQGSQQPQRGGRPPQRRGG